jgi:hypothetical protein
MFMDNQDTDYLSNPFSMSLMRSFHESTRNITERRGFAYDKNNHHLLTEKEKYQSRISVIQNSLYATIEQIKFIKTFLSRYPLKGFYERNGITQMEYVQYHMEALFHKVHTVLEIMKLMINEVYQLNIAKKDCSWINLCKKVNRKELSMKRLDDFFRAFANFIDARHLSSHRGVFNDKEKERIEVELGFGLYRFDDLDVPSAEEFKNTFPLPFIEMEIKRYRKSRLKLTGEVYGYICKIIKAFLTSLERPYLAQLKKY